MHKGAQKMNDTLRGLILACKNDDANSIRLMSEQGQLVVDKPMRDTKLRPLHFAVKYYATQCVRILLDFGADPNSTTRYGKIVPLTLAIERSFVPAIVRMLLDAKAKPWKQDAAGNSPLHYAAQRDDSTRMSMLLACTPRNKLWVTNRDGLTPLGESNKYQTWACAELLVQHGARCVGLNGSWHDRILQAVEGCETCRSVARVLYGVFKFRLRSGRDMARMVAHQIWITRMNEAWTCVRKSKKTY